MLIRYRLQTDWLFYTTAAITQPEVPTYQKVRIRLYASFDKVQFYCHKVSNIICNAGKLELHDKIDSIASTNQSTDKRCTSRGAYKNSPYLPSPTPTSDTMSMDVKEWQQIKGWVDEALAEARLGLAEGGIPIGSVLADPRTGEVVSRGRNLRVQASFILGYSIEGSAKRGIPGCVNATGKVRKKW